jgi:hypothetical protein
LRFSALIFTKNRLGYIFANFVTNASGHPDRGSVSKVLTGISEFSSAAVVLAGLALKAEKSRIACGLPY